MGNVHARRGTETWASGRARLGLSAVRIEQTGFMRSPGGASRQREPLLLTRAKSRRRSSADVQDSQLTLEVCGSGSVGVTRTSP